MKFWSAQQANRETDIEVLREIIPIAKARFMGNRRSDKNLGFRGRDALIDNNIGVDTPIPYRTSDLVAVLEEYIGKLELRGELAPYKRLKAKVEAVSRDPRYAFMFGSLTVQDNMAAVLARLFRIPVNGKPIAILELGGLPSEIINVVVSVLARLAFDFAVWSAGRVPITFVCEEAHRYVPSDKATGFEPTKRAISKIAKEGRKYGVSLCIVSQRPAELDPTILSQCNTVFSLRLTNERDQEILEGRHFRRGLKPSWNSCRPWVSAKPSPLVKVWPCPPASSLISCRRMNCPAPTPPPSPRTGRRTCPTTPSCKRSSTAGARRLIIPTALTIRWRIRTQNQSAQSFASQVFAAQPFAAAPAAPAPARPSLRRDPVPRQDQPPQPQRRKALAACKLTSTRQCARTRPGRKPAAKPRQPDQAIPNLTLASRWPHGYQVPSQIGSLGDHLTVGSRILTPLV